MRVQVTMLALSCALLSACGIKGSLHLPPAPGQTAAEGDHSKPFEPPVVTPRPPIE